MAITVKAGPPHENKLRWLRKNIGKLDYYLHNRIGGDGWEFKSTRSGQWELTFSDEAHASWWILYWS